MDFRLFLRNLVRSPKAPMHAAGLLAGSYLTADLLGYKPETVVADIELRPFATTLVSIPIFSKELESFAEGLASTQTRRAWLERDLDGYRAFVLSKARSAGLDVDGWIQSKIVQAVSGPAAWGKATNRLLPKMYRVYQNDFAAAATVGMVAGLSSKETGKRIFGYATDFLEEKFSQPQIWAGIRALAISLPSRGLVPGSECWAIFAEALGIERRS